ncbi:MAG: tRNA (guanosine(37)-N1)-methyltransferase TrmD, partial [Flavobacteriales bacterium]
HKVDDAQYGGGAGMVMSIEPIALLIEKLKSERHYDEIIFMTPDGELLEQETSNSLSLYQNIIILCGHYKGIDERIREKYITKEISIGSYVLSGGELGAAVLVDSIVRLIPGVLNDETSALTDSFQDGLLSPPVYTRPPEYNGMKVPEVLLSGDFGKIEAWRELKAMERTKERRPDLLDGK